MKILHKLIAIMICVLTLINTSVFAEDYTGYANELKSMGLFKGTDIGYELDKTLTRAESATMLVRLLGAEITATTSKYETVLSDVPEDKWYYTYIMYCYDKGITKGTGTDTFSPDDTVTAEQFVTLVLRALGYSDAEPENAFVTANSVGLFGTKFSKQLEESEKFLRNEMVYVAYRSLKTMTPDEEVLAVKLGRQGVLSKTQVEKFNIYEFDNINDFLESYIE